MLAFMVTATGRLPQKARGLFFLPCVNTGEEAGTQIRALDLSVAAMTAQDGESHMCLFKPWMVDRCKVDLRCWLPICVSSHTLCPVAQSRISFFLNTNLEVRTLPTSLVSSPVMTWYTMLVIH